MDSSLARDWSFFCVVSSDGCHTFAFFNLCSCILGAVLLRLDWGVFVANHVRDTSEPRPRYERTTSEIRANHGRGTNEPRPKYGRTTDVIRVNHGRGAVAKGVLSYNEKGVPVLPERLSRVVKVFSGGYFLKPMTRRTSFIVACALALATSAPSSAILSSSCGLALYSRIFSLIGATIAHKSCAICFFRSP